MRDANNMEANCVAWTAIGTRGDGGGADQLLSRAMLGRGACGSNTIESKHVSIRAPICTHTVIGNHSLQDDKANVLLSGIVLGRR